MCHDIRSAATKVHVRRVVRPRVTPQPLVEIVPNHQLIVVLMPFIAAGAVLGSYIESPPVSQVLCM